MSLNFIQGITIFHIISLFDIFPSSVNCEFWIFEEDNGVFKFLLYPNNIDFEVFYKYGNKTIIFYSNLDVSFSALLLQLLLLRRFSHVRLCATP